MEIMSSQLTPWFVTGLVEGEGCFSVSFTLRKKLKLGIETRPSFSISLNERDLPLIKQIHNFFGCGAVRYSKSDRTYKYEVRSVGDLVTIILPHFEQFSLKGEKKQDCQLFVEICRCVRANLHRSKTHLPEIIEKAYRMNPSGKRKHDKVYLLRMLDKIKV